MLSSKQVAGPMASQPMSPGGVAQWVLANDGAVHWPEGTTLRLVSGPILASPVLQVPSAAPGQTVVVDLEILPKVDQALDAMYALVTPCGQPFGELLSLHVAADCKDSEPISLPLCVVALAPNDGTDEGLECLQGEVKTVEWTLANVGNVNWPEDACCQLVYNTPGFSQLPTKIELPDGVAPGMTVQVGVSMQMPEKEGCFKAMWAVTSHSTPDFGDVLFVEFKVSEFPFMDWMLVENFSDGSHDPHETGEQEATPKMSAAHVMHEHLMPIGAEVMYPEGTEDQKEAVSMGEVSGLVPGSAWILELTLLNDGNVTWPQTSALSCCFGDGFACSSVPLGQAVQPGEMVVLRAKLQASLAPARAAWILTDGQDGCFGPIFVATVH
eukprot:TRINITY_DN9168_c0_g1_i1.p1 TRINITY_DN9168_c0_g1~~TRINITY_DN9168_c0_g1_i1.p1  ORF type:complete len:383 (+),score=89.91 TRINITY_DN9168_c0_g1_i1:57-1205(+)